jgi:transcriptional regulator with XRE-family HTH domain
MAHPPPRPSDEILERAFRLCVSELRERLGLSQEKLAGQAGIDRAYMSRMERGTNSPTLRMLYKLCAGFGISFGEFAAELDRCVRRVRRGAGGED